MLHIRLALLVAIVCTPPAAGAANAHSDAQRLHVEQQQHALERQLRNSAAARRHDLHPADQARLRQLELQQRLSQQQLELEAAQRSRALERSAGTGPSDLHERRARMERAAIAQQRALQQQRIELERQRALQSTPRQPLQSPLGAPQRELR